MSKVIVIGGGAAGMFAAIWAAKNGHQVLLLEKNEKLGKKLYITGKGRCNITNACDTEDLFKQVMHNEKFLYSAFYGFDNHQVIRFFEENGLNTKIERGERVFPQSDHSSDVIGVLQRVLKQVQVTVRLHTEVLKLQTVDGAIKGVTLKDGTTEAAEWVIVATGGCSYATTGSTGDGYRFAKETGHKIISPRPALVPFETAEAWVKDLQGLSLKNVTVKIYTENKLLYEEFGEMLFTHYGVSGPLLLSASSVINDYADKMPLTMKIDLKPALTLEQLDKRILRDFEENQNRQFKNAVQKLFPAKLIPVMISLSGISPEQKVNEITKEMRLNLVHLIKALPVTLSSFRGFNEAIITRGGVSVKDITPATMESKQVKGLYFAGEVLDLDALTGGFNLQIAWSTGYLAGDSIPKV
ncbi:MAG: NAD(P)/FAD-dependent oxidoreductase [Lachnospiraceae bacterium]